MPAVRRGVFRRARNRAASGVRKFLANYAVYQLFDAHACLAYGGDAGSNHE